MWPLRSLADASIETDCIADLRPTRLLSATMPILCEETSIYPELLLDGMTSEPCDHCWWAIYTRSRQEKVLARHLLAHEIPFYLPLVAKNTWIRGRTVRAHVPLFAGYVFMFGTPIERECSLKSNRICRVFQVPDSNQLLHDLRQVQQLIACGAPLTTESRLVAGQAVRVRRGAFAGMEGIVLGRRRVTRLVVSIDFIGQGVSVEIDDFLLEPID